MLTITEPTQILTLSDIKKLNVHDSNYLDFLSKATDLIYPSTFLVRAVKGKVQSYNYSDIKLQAGIWCSDLKCPISKEIVNQALISASLGVEAISKFNKTDKLIYCKNSLPGSQASYDFIANGCYLNNVAIAARTLNKTSVILDLSYHAGFGTYNIFRGNTRILPISIHIDPKLDYPYYYGFNDNYYNFTFQNTDEYLNVLTKAFEVIDKHEPEVLLIPFSSFEIDYELVAKTIREHYKGQIIVFQEGKDDDLTRIFLNNL
jgi:acetoin utilization deacetylase AcuC-like enzyme